ncbi:hypothetical protein [Gloeothece verrucosa]|uniref:Uncharacterized protein n=1 Tax=Gloeothece verrucosa (strain PCC 7822) TaxID=497965 RepID=E0ULZ2_GLOV7|nr:hypothetical protein [Gloeothece verrucosa]ADN17972.1 hypothetical protein Cyan7822_6141 [Gloeothece verrucosa PCC 7822]
MEKHLWRGLFALFIFFVLRGLAQSPSTPTTETFNESETVSQAAQSTPVQTVVSQGCNLANYQSLQTGMSYSNAAAILGPGTEMSRAEDPSNPSTLTIMYQWQNCQGNMGANMNAMFQGDRLIMKAQYGLK